LANHNVVISAHAILHVFSSGRSPQCQPSIKSASTSWWSSAPQRCPAIIELDATEADEVKILANNLPIASGVVLVDRNRIAVEVKQMLPRLPGSR
jgi:flagellar motor switch protein FliN/FliY